MNLKNLLIALGVVVLLAGGYFLGPYILPSSPAPSSSLESESGAPLPGTAGSPSSVAGGREFARVLVNLEGLTLSSRIFSDPVFRSLVDFSVDLEPQVKGRRNPFAPLGSDQSSDFVGEATSGQ